MKSAIYDFSYSVSPPLSAKDRKLKNEYNYYDGAPMIITPKIIINENSATSFDDQL
jgi:hypothetical protein